MIKMLTAYTLEADDLDCALSEIQEQLDLEHNLLSHAAGMLICHADFVETGVAQHIAGRLPFDVVGCTTLANMTRGHDESLMLSVSVFTSDDIRFSTLHFDQLDSADGVKAAYRAHVAGEEKPAMIVPFVPLMLKIGAEQVMLALDEASGGAPVFGTVALDHTPDFRSSYTFRNGQASQGAVDALVFWGDLNPRFLVSGMDEKYAQKQRAIITKSKDNLLMEVNNVPLIEYIKTIGLFQDEDMEGLGAVPFLIDYGDGTKPSARGIHIVTEEGYAYCGGLMPENATIAVGSVEKDDVLRRTRETLEAALGSGKRSGMLVFPCASHFLVLGADATEQTDILRSVVGDAVPYQLAYAGGEICPLYDAQGGLHNRFHSYTFTACIF